VGLKPTLHIVGSGPDGYTHYLRMMARRLGVESQVVFHGFRLNVRSYYAGADLVVVPSLEEAFGRAVVEAQLLGVPVIGSDSGGLVSLLPDNMRFQPGDSRALARVAQRILAAERQPLDARLLERHAPRNAARRTLEFILETLDATRA
jgi:glycosyltransferase involved in cell wall biosynthesis